MSFPSVIQGNEGDQFGDQITRLFGVGQKMELPDGRIYRYGLKGTAAGVANNMQQASVPIANNNDVDITVAILKDDNYASFTDGGTEPVNMEEGSVILEQSGDLGGFHRIYRAHTGTTESPIWFYPGVKAHIAMAVAANNALTFYPNPWAGFVIAASVPTAMPVGVAASIVASGSYGWLCTMGVVSCLVDSNTTALKVGYEVRMSEENDGALAFQSYTETDDADHGSIGRCLEIGVDGDFGLFYLRME